MQAATLVPLVLSLVAASGAAAGGIASAVQKGKAAKAQQSRANSIASGIKNMQKDPLSPYLTDQYKAAQDNAAAGLPGKDTYANQLDNATSEQLNTIKNSTPSGSTAAAAIARAVIGSQRSQQNLQIADAQTRLANQKGLQDVGLEVAKQDQANTATLNTRKAAAQGQVEALLNAATANKQQAVNDGVSAGSQLIGAAATSTSKYFNPDSTSKGSQSSSTTKAATTDTGIGSAVPDSSKIATGVYNATSEANVSNIMKQYGISREEAIQILNATR